jgi:hypothetical protein
MLHKLGNVDPDKERAALLGEGENQMIDYDHYYFFPCFFQNV